MADTVFKQCRYKGCRSSPRCVHPWWMSFSKRGRRHRMAVDEFAKKAGVGKTETEEVWLPKFITEMREGGDPYHQEERQGLVAARMRTVGDAIEIYIVDYIFAEGLNYQDSLRSKMNVLQSRFGALSLKELERSEPILIFKASMLSRKPEPKPATVNRYLTQLRHFINWCMEGTGWTRTRSTGGE